MFQKFENISDPSKGAGRVAALRERMAAQRLDAFLVPRADAHQGEYVAPCDDRLYWLTGFSGSAGFAAVLGDEAGLFVDGRYTLQARAQCDGDVFSFLSIPSDTLGGWLAEHLGDGERVGFDPMLHTGHEIDALNKKLEPLGIALVAVDTNLVDEIWNDRPAAPTAPVRLHDLKYAGVPATEKLTSIQKQLRKAGQDAMVLTLPDSIAWLLNIRGSDIGHNPVALAFAIVHAEALTELFIDASKLDEASSSALEELVVLHSPDVLKDSMLALDGKTVRVDPNTAGQWFFSTLEDTSAEVVRAHDLVLHAKARKNDAEIDGTRQAHIRDGVAMAQFLAWLDANATTGEVTEITAAQKLESCRAATGALMDISFDTISGSSSNGAIVHYRVTEATDRPLEQNSLYLIDSGGQYLDGTTDITRTIAIGTPSDDMRHCYTSVLKGHIALARARFPKGTRGVELDALARAPLWSAGLDYDHGTGHGIGSYLSVHEGPASISKRGMIVLQPGMILSNEPGYYREGAFGIRLENLVLVCAPEPVDGGDREMMSFETLSFTPFDRRLVNPALLDDVELDWLNDYHADVRTKLSGEIEEADVRAWLESATAPIER